MASSSSAAIRSFSVHASRAAAARRSASLACSATDCCSALVRSSAAASASRICARRSFACSSRSPAPVSSSLALCAAARASPTTDAACLRCRPPSSSRHGSSCRASSCHQPQLWSTSAPQYSNVAPTPAASSSPWSVRCVSPPSSPAPVPHTNASCSPDRASTSSGLSPKPRARSTGEKARQASDMASPTTQAAS